MIRGTDARPQRWSRVIDLYDDGEYSAIWGSFDGDNQRILGVKRWNVIPLTRTTAEDRIRTKHNGDGLLLKKYSSCNVRVVSFMGAGQLF